jgi:hypothetical protein
MACRPRRRARMPQRAYLAALAEPRSSDRRPATGRTSSSELRRRANCPRRRPGAIYCVPGRANGPRAGWLLASLGPSFVRRDCARPRSRSRRRPVGCAIGGGRRMTSAWRLREDAAPRGRHPGRGTRCVDSAIGIDGRRLLGQSDGLKAERNAISSRSASQRRHPQGQRSRPSARDRPSWGRGSSPRCHLAETEAALEGSCCPNPADGVPWAAGGQRHRAHVGEPAPYSVGRGRQRRWDQRGIGNARAGPVPRSGSGSPIYRGPGAASSVR